MIEYLLHSFKYLLKLACLLVIIYALMFVTGMARVSADQFVYELLHQNNGMMLMIALIVLAFIYPKFGFVKRVVRAGIETNREEIMKAFEKSGYALNSQSEGRMVFRASSIFKRLIDVFDDKIMVTYDDSEYIELEGIRKETVQIEFRIKSYVDNKTTEEK